MATTQTFTPMNVFSVVEVLTVDCLLTADVCVYRSIAVCVLKYWATVITVYLESQSLKEDTPVAVWTWVSA